jgi:pyruvate kinase
MDVLDKIIRASDAVMIARGDLGVEIGDEALPPAQKLIIKRSRELKRSVITATQMMESMIQNQIPTRAEVFDVANAVFDGTDAVMLSGETAVGKHPAKVIQAMARICCDAEQQQQSLVSRHRLDCNFVFIDEAIAMATMYSANHLHVKAIAALTESGSTPLWMSRISSGIPIYSLSSTIETRRRVTLYRGVYPISFDIAHIKNSNEMVVTQAVIEELRRQNAVTDGDLVIITKGDVAGVCGGTNTMKIVRVGDEADIPTTT